MPRILPSIHICGEIAETNPLLASNPGIVNTDPYGEGWYVKIQAADWDGESAELVTGADGIAAYQAFLDLRARFRRPIGQMLINRNGAACANDQLFLSITQPHRFHNAGTEHCLRKANSIAATNTDLVGNIGQ